MNVKLEQRVPLCFQDILTYVQEMGRIQSCAELKLQLCCMGSNKKYFPMSCFPPTQPAGPYGHNGFLLIYPFALFEPVPLASTIWTFFSCSLVNQPPFCDFSAIPLWLSLDTRFFGIRLQATKRSVVAKGKCKGQRGLIHMVGCVQCGRVIPIPRPSKAAPSLCLLLSQSKLFGLFCPQIYGDNAVQTIFKMLMIYVMLLQK
ncbi:unnamed protein product [Sphenostylis stenocarpa]|uniref:Uncharacterized protein n=1 Tax=Sphenostylis stenocarpa TaxID=92480 RepID=A0AA86SIW0_9FABA|nr:unnamed protein product [Sphenostylis stenocarpa]